MDLATCNAYYVRAKDLLAEGGPGECAEACKLLTANAAQGHAPSRYRLAEHLLVTGDVQQHSEAVFLLRTAAEDGHAPACFLLGLVHAHGLAGQIQDQAEAARWCAIAARKGLGVAQFNLGLLHAVGSGVAADPTAAVRWLRRAAINGVSEADGCLDIIYQDPVGERPRTWDAAETRASVALERTDRGRPKTLRFAEYYVDPCIDLVAQRFRLCRDELEDVVQQFFLELEEPLTRGEFRGQAWKESLRRHYDPGRGAFRPYLGRTLVNFVRDWIKTRDSEGRSTTSGDPVESDLELFAEDWRALLARFSQDTIPRRADAARAVEVLQATLIDNCAQIDLAKRMEVTDRTVRTALRLGVDLLREWLERKLRALPTSDQKVVFLLEGLELLPVWLHHPSAEKTSRTLLFLAVTWRTMEANHPPKVA